MNSGDLQMKNRSKIKETLRPIVQEALSDYLKDTEQDMRSLQNAHPQLDLSDDMPSETGSGDNVTKGVRTETKLNESGVLKWGKKKAIKHNQLSYTDETIYEVPYEGEINGRE